jgi:hypothetical protein
MTTLIDTDNWLIEMDAPRHMSITNRATGLSAMITGKRLVSDLRACLKTHSPDKVGACYARIASGIGAEWVAAYKRVPPVGGC